LFKLTRDLVLSSLPPMLINPLVLLVIISSAFLLTFDYRVTESTNGIANCIFPMFFIAPFEADAYNLVTYLALL
jgi:hypothetical protein